MTAPVPSADIWLSRPHNASRGGVPLLCLPNAGGGASLYYPWARLLSPEIELCPVQLPGRENRLRESALTRMDTLLDQLAGALAGYLTGPFAIFGHSLGGLIGFELARTLRRRYGLQPSRLFISARRPPQLPSLFAPIHRLPDGQFVEELARRYNGIPDLIREDPEMLSLYLPILRADVTVLETHTWVQEEPLDCPISVYGGVEDTSVPQKDLVGWERHSKQPLELKMFPGGHFYPQTARKDLLTSISHALVGLA